jgi:hypothetical protein
LNGVAFGLRKFGGINAGSKQREKIRKKDNGKT